MEHIHSCSGQASALQFPCLVRPLEKVYTLNGEWIDYPEAHGFDLENVRFLRWERFSAKKLAPFLQDWLFFGLLRAVLPDEIVLHIEDFVKTNEQGLRYIHTGKLGGYLSAWEEVRSKLSEEERATTSKRNKKVLDEARYFTYQLSHMPSAPRPLVFPPLPLECAFACSILGHTLSIENTKPIIEYAPWSTGDLLAEQLELQGWCPFIVEGIGNSHSHEQTTICYFTTLGGPKPTRNHTRCTETLCTHTEYLQPQHTGPCAACVMIPSPMSEVVRAIKDGSTPVLKYLQAMNSTLPKLEVHIADSTTPYIAISHVWCDGLGNPDGNAVHLCQAERLQQTVDQIFRAQKLLPEGNSGCWWLDTLCVPPREPFKTEKKKAIAQMKRIYEKAQSVLIIDSGLCTCDDETGVLEILARLRLSNWIRRLWTYQEGYFAKSIYLLVGSTPRSWASIVDAASKLPNAGYQNRIVWDLMNTFGVLFVTPTSPEKSKAETKHLGPGIEQSKEPEAENIVDGPVVTEFVLSNVFREFSSRVATQLRDEAKCLSLYLGLDTAQVLNAVDKEEERNGTSLRSDQPSEAGMVTVLRLANDCPKSKILRPQGCIPPSIVFPVCPRLRLSGFRWAPRSFLFSMDRTVYSDVLPLEVHDKSLGKTFDRPSGVLCRHGQGLSITFPGLIITKIDALKPVANFFIVDSSSAPSKGMPKFWRCTFIKDDNGRAWEGDIAPTNADSSKLAIIVGGFTELETSPSFPSILVRIKSFKCECANGGYAVERLGRMVGAPTPEYDTFEWVRDPWKRVEGRWLPLNQRWCVD
jgi:hypothetical protein